MIDEKISKKIIGSIIATGILAFCGVLVETSLNVTFPILIDEFQVNTATVQWLTTIYLLVLAIIVPLSGFFKRTFNNKFLFIVAVSFFSIGIFVNAIAPTFQILLLGRAIQGIGTGIGLPLMFNIIIEKVPSSKLGLMMGVGVMIPAIAPAMGPILIFSLIIGLLTIDKNEITTRGHIDFPSLMMIAVLFTSILFGISNFGQFSIVSIQVGGSLVLGGLGLIGLLNRSKKIENPILEFNLLLNRDYFWHVINFFIIQLVLMGLVFILPNYIQIINEGTPQVSGLVVFPGATIGALFTPLGGRILDRFGARKPILIGNIVMFLVLGIFTIRSVHLSNYTIGVLYFIFTIGLGFSFGNLMTNGLRQLTKEQQADGNAIIMTFQQFAGALGTSIIAAIISQNQSNKDLMLKEATIRGSQIGFLFLCILLLIEMIISFKIIKSRRVY